MRDIRRRELVTLLGGAMAAWPLAARAQKAPIRIGFLASGAAGSLVSASTIDAIKHGLSDNGLFEGRDYVLEVRFAAGNYERFPEFARELAQGGARVILATTIASVRAAQNVTPPVLSSCFRLTILWGRVLLRVSRGPAVIQLAWGL
jgi:putative ABC transport system substrate-binding protein